jgi:hypothetical protein
MQIESNGAQTNQWAPKVNAWLFVHPITLSFHLALDVFSLVLCTIPHPIALGLIHCICGQLLDLEGTHLFHCSHDGERIAFNDVIWDAFASITKDTRFHGMHEQTNVFSMPSFYFLIDMLTSCYQLMAFAP